MAAVGGFLALQGTLILSLQESRSYSYINVIPGQYFFQAAFSSGIPVHVKPECFECSIPCIEIEPLAPTLQLCPQFPGMLNNVAQTPVTAR